MANHFPSSHRPSRSLNPKNQRSTCDGLESDFGKIGDLGGNSKHRVQYIHDIHDMCTPYCTQHATRTSTPVTRGTVLQVTTTPGSVNNTGYRTVHNVQHVYVNTCNTWYSVTSYNNTEYRTQRATRTSTTWYGSCLRGPFKHMFNLVLCQPYYSPL